MDILRAGTTPTQPSNTVTITNSGPVQLTTGQLLRATVQSVTNSLVRLNVDGKMLTARTEVPLQPQQKVLLEVTQSNPIHVTMQVLKQAAAPQSPSIGSPTLPAQLGTMLNAWGVEADEINLTIAQGLLKHGQSITPADIQTVRNLWRGLADHQPNQLDTVAYLHTKQLPVNKEAVTLAEQWLNASPKITQQLTNLRLSLSETYSHLQSRAGKPGFPARLASTIQTALAEMSQWSVSTDTPPQELTARLTHLIKSLGTPPEAELARSQANVANPTQLPVQRNGQPLPASPPVGVQANSGSVAGETPPPANPVKGGEPPLTGSGNQVAPPHGEIATQAAKPLATEPTASLPNPIHRLASAINETLARPDLDEATRQTLGRLSGQLEETAKALGSLQLSNASNPINPTSNHAYFFPIPLNLPGGDQTAQLKVYRQPGRRNVDPDNMRLALLLDLPGLGEIAVNLSVYRSERQLTGEILSGQAQTNQLVTAELADLHDSLSALGYQVNSLTADMLPVEERNKFGAEAETMTLTLSQVNVRA